MTQKMMVLKEMFLKIAGKINLWYCALLKLLTVEK